MDNFLAIYIMVVMGAWALLGICVLALIIAIIRSECQEHRSRRRKNSIPSRSLGRRVGVAGPLRERGPLVIEPEEGLGNKPHIVERFQGKEELLSFYRTPGAVHCLKCGGSPLNGSCKCKEEPEEGE